MSSITSAAARGGAWFGAMNIGTQVISWVFTFYVIRLLDPQDYGLMSMAAFLTAYLQIFSELGLGSAIVQRENINDREVNSVFWFSLSIGIGMAILAFALAYPTAWLFSEPRVVRITQLIGVLFVITALTTVPYNLLSRRFEFKKVATANLVGTLVSSVFSIVLALNHYGVYTLIWTNIVLNATKMLILFAISGWRPKWHYSHREVRPYLSYGIYLALSSSSLRLFQTLDKMIIGKIFGSTQLGLYSNAMTIASMPLDKIWPVYQQVAFPLFSRLQDQKDQYIASYLGLASNILLVIGPICLGSAMVAPELIMVVLGAKWLPMAVLFQCFCVAKLFELLVAYQVALLNATGRHKEVFWFYALLVLIMPTAVLLAALYSFKAVMFPWLILYPIISIVWILRGLHVAGISIGAYAKSVFQGLSSSLIMVGVLALVRRSEFVLSVDDQLSKLIVLVAVGVVVFSASLLVFQRKLVRQAIDVLRRRNE